MRRKHMPGCYCCQGCYIIPDEELPTITVPGYTFTSWGSVGGDDIIGGLCCRCAFFSPNNTEYTEVCSDYFAETTLEQVTSWVVKTIEAPLPLVTCGFSGSIETTADHVCYGDAVEVATHTVEDTLSKKWKLFTRYRPGLLRICISKQLVTCDDEEPVEKWVVLSVFQYELFAYLRSEISRSISSESELLHPCFRLKQSREACDDSCSQQVGDACDDPYDDIGCCTTSTFVEFFRVKLFDELPEGDVTFDDTAKPENCDWEFCEDPGAFLDQFCVSISSWPTAVYSCVCEETIIDPLFCEVTYDKFKVGCACPDFLGGGYAWRVILPGSEPCIDILSCDNPCEYFDCGTYTVTEFCTVGGLPGGAIVGPPSGPCAGRWGSDAANFFGHGPGALCQFYAGPRFKSIDATGGCWEQIPCTNDDCGPDCCYSIECDNCGGCLGSKFVGLYEEITAFTRDWTCELTPTSFCLNAPTWTATFA